MGDQDDKKRKYQEEAGQQGRRKPKRLRLEKLTNWGEQMNDYDKTLPDGWWTSINFKDAISNKEVKNITTDNSGLKKKQAA